MKKGLYIILILFLGGCSKYLNKSIEAKSNNKNDDGKYEYVLTEALRQKYVGKISDAIVLLEKCIEIDPQRSVPYFELSQIYSVTGRNNEAIRFARKAADIERNNYWYQVSCGSVYLQCQKKDSAIVYIENAIKIKPGDVRANILLAGLYEETGQTQKADSVFLILQKAGMITDDLFMVMISGLIEQKNFNEAANRTKKAIEANPSEVKYKAILAEIYSESGNTERCDSIYSDIINKDPDNVESQSYVLTNELKNRKYEEASEFIKNIFKSENIEKERKIQIAEEILEDSLYSKAYWSDVTENFKILEEKYSDDEQIMSLRPLLYEEIDKDDEAINRYKEILKKFSPGFYFKEHLINLLLEEKRYEELFTVAGEYSKQNNMSITAKVYYGLAAMELAKYEIAETELKKALILAGNQNTMIVQIYSMLGELKYRANDFGASFEYLKKALEINPDDVTVLNNYAYYLAERNTELKKALIMAKKVMNIEGSNPTYVDTYAWILYKMGKAREAKENLEKFISLDNDTDAELLEHMGFILRAIGKCDEAVLYWRKSLETDKKKTYLNDEILKCGQDQK